MGKQNKDEMVEAVLMKYGRTFSQELGIPIATGSSSALVRVELAGEHATLLKEAA